MATTATVVAAVTIIAMIFLMIYLYWTYYVYRWSRQRVENKILRAYMNLPWKRAMNTDVVQVENYVFRKINDKVVIDVSFIILRKFNDDGVEIEHKTNDSQRFDVIFEGQCGINEVSCISL